MFLVYAYPGYLAPGVADQLVDARIGQFTDWHPVVLTEIWRHRLEARRWPVGDVVHPERAVTRRRVSLLSQLLVDRVAAYFAVAILWFPPVIATTSVIAPSPMLGEPPRRWNRGTLLSNTPVADHGAGVVCTRGRHRRSRSCCGIPDRARVLRRGSSAPSLLGLPSSSSRSALPYVLVDDRTQRPELERALHDIAGTLRYAPALSADEVAKLFEGCPIAAPPDQLQQRAKRAYPKPGQYVSGETRLFDGVERDQIDAVVAARDRLVRAQPRAYLHHRFRMWKEELWFHQGMAPVPRELRPCARRRCSALVLEHALPRTAHATDPVRWTSHTSLFRPHLYLMVAVILLAYALVRRRREAAVLLASGLAYELALMFTAGVTPQFFDSQWLVVATLLGAVLIAFGELEPRHKRIGEQAPLGVAEDDRVPHG